jgi:hypothetical protein
MERQITNTVFMVRPKNFGFNEETALNNAFQTNDQVLSKKEISKIATTEFDNLVIKLKEVGIIVEVFEDKDNPITPDAVFPNNWITFHQKGLVISYPMFAPIRRQERRPDIINELSNKYEVKKDYTFEHYEDDNLFLEGTGSLVLDRANKIAYAALSPRTDVSLLDKWCILMDYRKVHFNAFGRSTKPIYHTNVLMALGEDFVVICMESIPDKEEQKMLLGIFKETGKKVIKISFDQMASYAGNMLQLQGVDGKTHLVMSQSAYDSLDRSTIAELESMTNILTSAIPTIEKYGGGSVRCMISEIFLPIKKK